MMFSTKMGFGSFGKPKPQKNPFDINVGELGFSQGYGDKLNSALDQVFQNQVQDTRNQAQESALAGGSFNPQVSNYYAVKGAQDAQAKGKVDAMGQARADEYNRFNVRNAINNFNLQKDYFNLQKEQYDDSKPSWLDDVMGIAGGVLPFLAKGGEIKDSSYYQQAYNGEIPTQEINSNTETNGDNTLIKAQPGEVIQSNPAGELIGRNNLQLINNAGQMVNDMFANSARSMAQSVRPPMGVAPAKGNGMVDKLKGALGNLFGGGASSATPMANGGMAGDDSNPYTAQLQEVNRVYNELQSQAQQTDDAVALQQINNAMKQKQAQGQLLLQQAMEWDRKQKSNVQGGQEVPNTTSPGSQGLPGMAQGGQVQKKVIIEEKPAGY